MIQLTKKLKYDSSKSFEQQSNEVQEFLVKQMAKPKKREICKICKRVERDIWIFDKYQITNTYLYINNNEQHNCFALRGTQITVTPTK